MARSDYRRHTMKILFLLPFLALSALAQTNEPAAQPVTLTWEAGDPSAAGITFKVYIKSGTNEWTPVMTTTNTQLTLILKPDAYSFKVTALLFWGESAPSNVVTVPSPSGPESTPKNLNVQLGVPNKPNQ